MPKLPAVGDKPIRHRVFKELGEAAEYLGMSPRTLRDWRADGLIQPTKDGRWSTKQIREVAERKIEEAEREMELPEGVSSPNLERFRGYRADIAKMERDRMAGLLIERASVEEEMLAKCNFLSNSLDYFALAVVEKVGSLGIVPTSRLIEVEWAIQEEVEEFKDYLSGKASDPTKGSDS